MRVRVVVMVRVVVVEGRLVRVGVLRNSVVVTRSHTAHAKRMLMVVVVVAGRCSNYVVVICVCGRVQTGSERMLVMVMVVFRCHKCCSRCRSSG